LSHQYIRKEDVEGKVVIDPSGKTVGKAREIAFSLDGTLALIVVGIDNSESQIPTSKIQGFADYIILKTETASAAADPNLPIRPPQATSPPVPRTPLYPPASGPPPGYQTGATTCSQCKSPLRAAAKFCTKCGARAI
jgi:sporulation protein YlmC with PRC-barrel domain